MKDPEVITKTLEDYIKTVLKLSEGRGKNPVPLGELAKRLALSPGTVTTMVRRFSKAGWLEYYPRKGCRLTRAGEEKALSVLKKHRLVEFFLTETLGMKWDEVHKEAENLEHSFSDEVIERLDSFLGYPSLDPHGKRIFRSLEDISSNEN